MGTTSGILVWTGDEISQKLDSEGFSVIDLALPHRSTLVYAVCEDSSLRIYDQNYSTYLIKMDLPPEDPPIKVFVPETEYENKKLSLTNHLFLTTRGGKLYKFNLLQNRSEPSLLTKEDEEGDRNIIFRGVNILGESYELVSLWRDLKCRSDRKPTKVSLEATVANIKVILEENRKVHSLMEAETGLSIV